jgi:NAD(P)-dependent dehydrogenase (short-subunit alcohol dehydrogenase family)
VTGASKGIGREIAMALAEHGCQLVLVSAHSTHLLSETAQACVHVSGCSNVLEFVCDVRDDGSVDDLVRMVADKFGSVDILVNCAGIGSQGEHAPWESRLNVLETDLVGLMRVTYKMLQVMTSPAGGAIINIGSIAGIQPVHSQPHKEEYAAAKAGVNAFTHGLFESVRDRGIKCSVIHPGYVFLDSILASVG